MANFLCKSWGKRQAALLAPSSAQSGVVWISVLKCRRVGVLTCFSHALDSSQAMAPIVLEC